MAEEKKTAEAGDVVRLNSGGPEMTVARDLRDGDVECIWFVHGAISTTMLPAKALEVLFKAAET